LGGAGTDILLFTVICQAEREKGCQD
jgi:hypothetical protein